MKAIKRQEYNNVNSGRTSLSNACKCPKQDAVNANIVCKWQAYCFSDACTCRTQGVAFAATVLRLHDVRAWKLLHFCRTWAAPL
jgi:hypothetical protein